MSTGKIGRRKRARRPFQRVKSQGHPIEGILKAARWMDHVILGSIADKAVRHTLVPVMIVH